MSAWVPLKVTEVKRETRDAVRIFLEPPADQKIAFTNFKPGQYLTFEIPIPGFGPVRRSYSLCSLPGEEEPLAVVVKKVENGLASKYLNDSLKAGDILWSLKPEGRFTPALDPARRVQYFLIAGGSGITPIYSILKAVLRTERESLVTLVYANRNKDSVIFANELLQLARAYRDRFTYIQALDSAGLFWNGLKGPLMANDFAALYKKQFQPSFPQEFYVCGPTGMMQEAIAGLTSAGVSKDAIKIEYFKPAEQTQSISLSSSNAVVSCQACIILGGKEYQVPVPKGTTLLKAAQDFGLDPPYSCEAGVCSTCMAKLLDGQVKMIENNILTEKEVQEGYILTCQALCLTPSVKLEYPSS
ncbi:MAG: ferredoxin--NADP reductase [Flavobacteriales bacterium]|nr:ferredoxin--NADP reductase [Flavobacteriales bacterium]MCX7767477.1 ferredoxin--NADP reductase [Flavobacteriales bacterium]MDW8409613.1 ferredoxin--NADP reductase [Flavobacteriales bacterium]